MAYSETDRSALKSAIARGVRRVKMNGEEVEYNSLSDMRAALRVIESELDSTSASAVSVSYPKTSRGL